jgi:putative DNA primase/helicase
VSDTQSTVEEPAAPGGESTPEVLAYRPFTDSGNAERFVAFAGGNHLYVEGIGWHSWDGRRFEKDESSVMRTAKRTARGTYEVGQFLKANGDAEEQFIGGSLKDHARKSESARGLRSMVTLAANEVEVRADVDELDANPWLLNVANGTIDLRTGELRPASRDDRITKVSPIVFDPKARDDVWEQTLRDIGRGHDGLSDFLQLVAGYSMSASTREDLIVLFDGPGGSRKTSFCDSVRSTIGEYGHVAPFDMFTQRKGDTRHAAEIAALRGKRLVTVEEGPKGKRFDTARLKELDGSKPVAAQHMRQEWFNFQPIAKLWFVTNYRPHVHAEDTGAWRRLLAVPFTNAIPQGQQDSTIRTYLQTSPDAHAAILSWAVQGAVEYWDTTKDGKKLVTFAPECVLLRTGEWQRDSDRVGAWIEDECILGEGWVSSTALQNSINSWWKTFVSGDFTPPSLMASLGDDLRAKGCYPQKNTNDVRGWAGIRLRNGLGSS